MLSLQAGPIPLLSSRGHFQHQHLAGQQPTTLNSEIANTAFNNYREPQYHSSNSSMSTGTHGHHISATPKNMRTRDWLTTSALDTYVAEGQSIPRDLRHLTVEERIDIVQRGHPASDAWMLCYKNTDCGEMPSSDDCAEGPTSQKILALLPRKSVMRHDSCLSHFFSNGETDEETDLEDAVKVPTRKKTAAERNKRLAAGWKRIQGGTRDDVKDRDIDRRRWDAACRKRSNLHQIRKEQRKLDASTKQQLNPINTPKKQTIWTCRVRLANNEECGVQYKGDHSAVRRRKHLETVHNALYLAAEDFRYYQGMIQHGAPFRDSKSKTQSQPQDPVCLGPQDPTDEQKATYLFNYADMLCSGEQSFASLLSDRMKRQCRHASPQYPELTRDSLYKTVVTNNHMWRRKIKEYLSREVDHCSLTADCWTGSGDKKFLGVTLHCLTCEMEPITIVLGMIPIRTSQSGVELARLLGMTSFICCVAFCPSHRGFISDRYFVFISYRMYYLFPIMYRLFPDIWHCHTL